MTRQVIACSCSFGSSCGQVVQIHHIDNIFFILSTCQCIINVHISHFYRMQRIKKDQRKFRFPRRSKNRAPPLMPPHASLPRFSHFSFKTPPRQSHAQGRRSPRFILFECKQRVEIVKLLFPIGAVGYGRSRIATTCDPGIALFIYGF